METIMFLNNDIMYRMRSIVVAYDSERTIGRNGELPWAGKLPADMRRFRELTTDQSVIMGRKTYESLPEAYRPLPRRQNIIMSLSVTAIQGAEVVHNFDEAYETAKHEAFIIGGAEIYAQSLPTVDKVFATEILTSTAKGDAFFPELKRDEWITEDALDFPADEKNRYDYSFVTYVRRNPLIQ
jgi:dihydrofolate reductase